MAFQAECTEREAVTVGCSRCGAALAPEYRFCGLCGAPRPEPSPLPQASPRQIKVNLGAGRDCIPGYFGLDRNPEWAGVRPDVIADLDAGLPFADRSLDVINACHVLEHIRKLIPLVNECWRVLNDDGFMMVAVPRFPSDAAVGPPDHVRYFTATTFMYFERAYCSPGVSPWIREVSAEITGPFLRPYPEDPQLFVLMRPDRG